MDAMVYKSPPQASGHPEQDEPVYKIGACRIDIKDFGWREEEELYPDGSSKYGQRLDTSVAAAAVVHIPSDGSPIVTVTYVIPRHMGGSAAESEHVAALFVGIVRAKM